MLIKHKNIMVSCFILLCIFISVLTSCSKASKSNDMTTEQNILPEQSAPAELSMESLKDTYPDKKILTWVYNDVVHISQEQNLAINNTLSDKGYNFVIVFKQIPESSYQDTINSLIDNGTPPDIISAGVGIAGTLQGTYRAVKDNWLEDLDSYLVSSNGKKLKEAFPEDLWKTFYVNGKIYGVTGFLPTVTNYTYYVNTDIANKYGINTTDLSGLQPEKLGSILKKVYDGEASEDFDTLIPLDNAVIANYIPLFDIYNNQCRAIVTDLQSNEPKVVNLFEQDYALQYFKAMSDYAAKGYINSSKIEIKNFFIDIKYNDFFGNNAADNIEILKKKYPNCTNITSVNYAPFHLTSAANTITGVCRLSAEKDTALEALTVSVTDKDISNLLLYGIKGINYTLTTEGKVEQTEPLSWYTSAYFGNPLVTTPTTKEPDNKNDIIVDVINHMKCPSQLGDYFDFQDISKNVTNLDHIVAQYDGLFSGKYEDVDATLDELNTKLYENGLEDIINEINLRFDKLAHN